VRFEGPPGSLPDWFRRQGAQSGVGSPIVVKGAHWGVATAVFTHDAPLDADMEARISGFTELIATAISNAEAQAQLTASRARIVATADETRRRIERDLHDGAQQRLVSLTLQLRAAQAAVPPELDELRSELDRVSEGLTKALEELREYARGIHPAILAEGGLGSALRTLARNSAVPVDLTVDADERLPDQVEVAAYYVVSESLANAAKHAHAATVEVDVETLDGALRISVRDDGRGGADLRRGSGLVGLKDRVEALGGRIVVESPAGAGTAVQVELPLADGRDDGSG
jgi:signal transduction histidine kinase